MQLIDWAGVTRNALWIVGLSGILAAWSYAAWWAGEHRSRLRQALARPAFQAPLAASLLLFAAGLAWGAGRLWERIAWIGLALACAVLVWESLAIRRHRGQHSRPRGHHEEKET